MLYWLSSPKVRLGLLVNGLYFISLALPSQPPLREPPYAHTVEAPRDMHRKLPQSPEEKAVRKRF